MNIKINSQLRDVAPGTLLGELLEAEGVATRGGVAVAINGVIVKKPDWAQRQLMENDDLIIINAAYGG